MGVLDSARRIGLSRGVFGDSRPWLVIGGIAWGIRAVQWALKPPPQVVVREVLEPGQTIVIEHGGSLPGRRERRRAAKAQRRLDRSVG
ncbi:MAG: hypothetical protein MUE36_05700 [Acidimicrobiales bacterium]|jgi:hypothetical protein|nr:hypothetical protein [Acidimicrobiales bacterium]